MRGRGCRRENSSNMGASESRDRMLHQDRLANPKYGGQGGGIGGSGSPSLRLLSNSQQQQLNRKREKDSNFNFLGQEDDDAPTGDENRNPMRPRHPGQLGRDAHPPPPPGVHYGPSPLSPLSRLPCWSPLEPLPEIESGDDCYGRVPPDGAEEGKMEEEEEGRSRDDDDDDKEPHGVRGGGGRKEAGGTPPPPHAEGGGRGGEEGEEEGPEEEEELQEDDGEEWGDSDSEFEFCYRSGGSLSSLNMESGGEGAAAAAGGWDRVGVGETRSDVQETAAEPLSRPPRKREECSKRKGGGKKTLAGSARGSSLPEEEEEDEDDDEEEEEEERERGGGGGYSDSDTDPCGDTPEGLDSEVWSLRDRERFKAQEMEKHQVQLTMYRRLALIRWVRTLQSRVQEQQNRLQSSFDVILDHRKELLRMGAATPATAAVSQS